MLLAIISSCDGCRKTLDKFFEEALIDIPKGDRTPPKIWFEVTDVKTGEVRNITTNSEITKNRGDVLRIVLWGEDADGGVKKLCLSNGFSYRCCNNGNPNVCSLAQTLGVNNCQDFSNLTTQAFKKWFIISELELSFTCSNGFEYESGSYGLTGTVENYNGGQASIGLGILVK